MALEGTIKDFGLADILQLIGLQRKTGLLTLERHAETVTVKFLDGAVVGADTSQRSLEELLGSVLVRTGRITEAQLKETLRIQKKTMQRVGYILVKEGYVSAEDLEEALRIQASQIVYRLFRWRVGKYQFAPMDHIEYDNEHFRPLSAETILMEGARMIDEWPMLERKIKSPSVVFRQTEAGANLDVPVASLLDADIDFGFADSPEATGLGKRKPAITPDERDVLHLVDGRSSVQDIADLSALAEFDIYRNLFELLNKNLIEEVSVAASVVAASAATAASTAAGNRWLSGILQGAVIGAALTGMLALPASSLAPWHVLDRSHETEMLKRYASRNRLERVERSLQAYYLDRGAMPANLEALTRAGYLHPRDASDPWGQPYGYSVDASGYELFGQAPQDGGEEIAIRHPFSASQRMVLQGGLIDRSPTIRP